MKRNELLQAVKHLGRTIWKKWSGYHRRSLVETKMHFPILGQLLQAAAIVQASILPIQCRSAEGISKKSVYVANWHTQLNFPFPDYCLFSTVAI